MIVCTRCGFQNEDSDTFCGSCAGFLEWEGQRIVAEAPPEPEPEPEPAVEEHVGLIERVKEKIGIGEDRSEAGDEAASVAAGSSQLANAEAETPAPPPPPGPVSAPVPVPAPFAATSAPPAPAVTGVPVAATEAPATQMTASAAAPPSPLPAPPVVTPPPGAPTRTQSAAPAPPLQPAQPARPTVPKAFPGVDVPKAFPGVPAQPAQPPQPPHVIPAAGAAGAAAGTASTAVQPGAVQPEAVKPGAVKARPTQKKEASSRTINPGDKICGQCGEGNDPARKFCRRCGASLVEAAIFTLPWYTRWWRKLTQRKQRVAGDRPQQRRRAIGGSGPGWLTSWVTRIIVLAILVVVLLAFVGPFSHSIKHRASTWYHDVVNVVHPTYNQVHPISASATSSVAGHPASNLIDGASNTSWQAAKAGPGQFAILRFAKVANLAKIGFLNGDQDNPAAYVSEPRPQTIQVVFGGKYRTTKTITLKDTNAFQTFGIKTKDTTGVTIVIKSVYPSSAGGNNVSMAEIELFSKSG